MNINCKKDFPIFSQSINNHDLVYLDSAATTQKPICVIKRMQDYYFTCNANVHRGIHTLSEKATKGYENARTTVGKFINASSSDEIIFTRNATEGINLVALCYGTRFINPGDTILLTRMEHHSNLIPWQQLAGSTGAKLAFLEIDSKGQLKNDQFQRFAGHRIKLVAMTHASNLLGTINPVAHIIAWAHGQGAKVLIDGAQSVPHMAVDVQELDCDFLVFSGHKMMGPTGIGVLYAKRTLLDEMPPLFTGGEMITDVSWDRADWAPPPHKFEAGTPCIAQAMGLESAIQYLNGIGWEAFETHMAELTTYAMAQLACLEGIQLYGPGPEIRVGLVSFNVKNIHPHDLATLLDEEGIAIRAGHLCAQPLVRSLGITATARASFYIYNTYSDIDHLISSVEKAIRVFSK